MNALEIEIKDLHSFFEKWFAGDLPDDDVSFARLEDALAPAFTMVSPRGEHLDREAVVDGVRRAHGAGPRRIWIDNVELLDSANDRLTAAYEEWQEDDGETTARLATVVFSVDFNARNGLKWLRVHETWMEPSVALTS